MTGSPEWNLDFLLIEATLEGSRHRVAYLPGRSPSRVMPEAHSEVDARAAELLEEVAEALAAGRAYALDSLDTPAQPGSSFPKRARLARRDRRLQHLAARITAAEQIAELPTRKRRILFKRFFEGKSQREIADDDGISQTHLSRLLRDALDEVGDEAQD